MSNLRKKLSGAEFRKRKMLKEDFVIKQSGSLQKYLRLSPKESQEPENSVVVQKSDNIGEKSNPQETLEETSAKGIDDISNGLITAHSSKAGGDSISNDPAAWENLTENLRQILIERGPIQVKNFDFPYNEDRRKFSELHYKRRLVNGEYVSRSWLLYSTTKDAVFCFCCKLLSEVKSSLSSNGVNDWKNIHCILSLHEKSAVHLGNYQKWKEFETRLKTNKTIDKENLRLIRAQEHYWQQVLERLVALVRVLGSQNIPFRGSSDTIFSNGNGNFLKFVEYLSLFDPVMQEHVRKVNDKETHVHYLGKTIQNEMIALLAVNVQKKILASIHSAKYYSIILDCTPDISHVEQMTIIARFVDIVKNDKQHEIKIREHFLGFVPLTDTTGAGLTKALLAKLEELSLPLENLRGQGYDNGSNMKGKHSGVQKRILDINPRALYVPCSSHTLNLVVNDAAKCCMQTTSFFNLIQNVYVYFSASTYRWGVLLRHVPSLTVKPLSDTRWESRIDALRPLRYQLHNVHDALMDIYEDETLIGSSGTQTRFEAQAIANKIANIKFIASLVVWYNILFEINLTSKALQSKQYDLISATNALQKTKIYLQNCRTDIGFENMMAEAKDLAEEINVSSTFELETAPGRLRKQKRQFNYEGEDEPIRDAKQNFKINFYFTIIDTALSSIDERFNQLKEVTETFGFLCNIHQLNTFTKTDILKHCKNLETSLTHGVLTDIDAQDLCNEVQVIARKIADNSTPVDVLDYICSNELIDIVPNLFTAIRLLLTLPVSVASGERSFSKLKLIKTYLRSTMCQERLVGLATLSIENEVAQTLDIKTVVSDFGKLKARKYVNK